MAKRTILYHKEYQPDGREFDLHKHSLDSLVTEGWVDNPAKFGHNIWGGEDSDLTHIKAQFEAGELGPMDPVIAHAHSAEMDALQRENSQVYERLREKENEAEALRRELRESKEKLGDHRSDAAKIEDAKAAAQTQVPGTEPLPEKQQGQDGAASGDPVDL